MGDVISAVTSRKGECAFPSDPTIRSPRRRALIIGINYEFSEDGTWPWRLRHSHKDCDRIEGLIRQVFGYDAPNSEIRVMKDSKDTPTHLQPKRKNILDQLQWLVEGSACGDKLFMFYTGHGIRQICNGRDLTGKSTARAPGCIIPSDPAWEVDYPHFPTSVISTEELRGILVDLLPSEVKLTAIFESCYSGHILGFYYRETVISHCAFEVERMRRRRRLALGNKSTVTIATQKDTGALDLPFYGPPLKDGTCPQGGATTSNAVATVLRPKDKIVLGRVASLCLSACGTQEQTFESPDGGILAKALCAAFERTLESVTGPINMPKLHDVLLVLQQHYDKASEVMPPHIGPMPNIHITSSHPWRTDAMCDF